DSDRLGVARGCESSALRALRGEGSLIAIEREAVHGAQERQPRAPLREVREGVERAEKLGRFEGVDDVDGHDSTISASTGSDSVRAAFFAAAIDSATAVSVICLARRSRPTAVSAERRPLASAFTREAASGSRV